MNVQLAYILINFKGIVKIILAINYVLQILILSLA